MLVRCSKRKRRRQSNVAGQTSLNGVSNNNKIIIIVMIIIMIINNNNNNSKTMFMVLSSWQNHCESSPGSFGDCRKAPSGRRPKTKPDHLGCECACTGCQSLHSPSPFIFIIQPESWHSFYRPTEGEGWVDLVGWLHIEMVYPSTDGHPSWY